MNRKEVLKEVTKLTETHCKKCQVTKLIEQKVMNQRFCLDKCVIGKEFQRLGEILTPKETAKKKIEKIQVKRRPAHKYAHITREILQMELDSGKTYEEIERSLGMSRKSLPQVLTRHGLEGRRGANFKPIKSIGMHQTGHAQSLGHPQSN